MHGACMATKTISIDLEAYGTLRHARTHEKESFSQVIKRALWQHPATTGRALLESLDSLPAPSHKTIRELEANQKLDHPPSDSWDS